MLDLILYKIRCKFSMRMNNEIWERNDSNSLCNLNYRIFYITVNICNASLTISEDWNYIKFVIKLHIMVFYTYLLLILLIKMVSLHNLHMCSAISHLDLLICKCVFRVSHLNGALAIVHFIEKYQKKLKKHKNISHSYVREETFCNVCLQHNTIFWTQHSFLFFLKAFTTCYKTFSSYCFSTSFMSVDTHFYDDFIGKICQIWWSLRS